LEEHVPREPVEQRSSPSPQAVRERQAPSVHPRLVLKAFVGGVTVLEPGLWAWLVQPVLESEGERDRCGERYVVVDTVIGARRPRSDLAPATNPGGRRRKQAGVPASAQCDVDRSVPASRHGHECLELGNDLAWVDRIWAQLDVQPFWFEAVPPQPFGA